MRSPEVRQSLALERATVTIRVDRALACGAIDPNGWARNTGIERSRALERAAVAIGINRRRTIRALHGDRRARNACINGLFGAAAIEVSTTVVTRARATIEVCAAINFGAGAAAIHDQIAALQRAPITVAVDQPNPRGAPN